MKRLLDGVFDFVFGAFDSAVNKELDESAKGSVIKAAAQKLRIIGKILKTQKVWKVGDEFKKAYMDEMKRLIKIQKEEGDEALMKELLDKGVINPMYLDEKSRDLFFKIKGGKTDDEEPTSETPHSEPTSYTDSFDSEDVEPYEGKLYYSAWMNEDSATILELSDMADGLRDSDFEKFGIKFEKDFPDYWVAELQESVFEVYYKGTTDYVDIDELQEALDANPDYEMGDWESQE